jgi:CHAD domain-containing protein
MWRSCKRAGSNSVLNFCSSHHYKSGSGFTTRLPAPASDIRPTLCTCLPTALIVSVARLTTMRLMKPPVFVVGCPQSGTTLLYSMLIASGGFAFYRKETYFYDQGWARLRALQHAPGLGANAAVGKGPHAASPGVLTHVTGTRSVRCIDRVPERLRAPTMLTSPTPSTLFVDQVHTLRSQLPAVLDGAATGIHDARVSTRRIRELLQVAERSLPCRADELRSRFKKMGRALGRVRETDVHIEMLAALETQIPSAAPWLMSVRREHQTKRLKRVRSLIKRLEQLGMAALLDAAIANDWGLRRLLLRLFDVGRWQPAIAQTVRERALAAEGAIEHATGVYFPNRVHTARIAVKKLRYGMEVAAALGDASSRSQLRDLKKTQDVLGDLHDRQTLLDALTALPEEDGEAYKAFVTHVRPALEAERDDFHNRYLARRERLLQIARDAHVRHRFSNLASASLITAGALALSTSAYAMHRRLPHAQQT